MEDREGHAERHLGGPDDDHYATLSVQPIEVIEAWSKTWPQEVVYHLGEMIAALSRVGTKGQPVRDLKKVSWLAARAASVLEEKEKRDEESVRAVP